MKGIKNRIEDFAKSAPFRKGKASALAVVKMVRRISSSELDYAERPPIIINSLPKSGTHLLLQVVLGLPAYTSYGSFIATTPSLTMRRRSDEVLSRKIMRLSPGEVCGAHLYYSERVKEALRQRRAISLFIHRDPRDVFWSEMQYLLSMNPWHRSSRHARRILDSDERFDFFLHGKQEAFSAEFEWPNFANRLEPYMGWLTDSGTFSCRYEEFMNPDRLAKTLDALATYLRARAPIVDQYSQDELVDRFREAIRPEASHTYRNGNQHEWRTELAPSQIAALEEEVACLLPHFVD